MAKKIVFSVPWKSFGSRKVLCKEKFCIQNSFGPKRGFDPKTFWSEENISSNKNGVQKNFGSKTVGLKLFVSKKNFGQKEFWVPNKFWVWKKFGSEKILGQKNFVVVLVLPETWTPNPLNSAKSP